MSYSASVTSYISETAHPTIRGSLVTLRALSMATGLLMTWTLGYFVTWRMIAYILTIPPILLFLFLLLLPETPYWLVEHDNVTEARKSLQFFRGQNYDITDEFNEIQQKHVSKKCQYTKKSWSFTIKRMFSPAFLKPFSCVGILYMINSWLGFSPLMTFSFEILEKAGSNIDPGIGLIIIGSIRVLFAGMNKICIVIKQIKLFSIYFQEWLLLSFTDFNQRFFSFWQLYQHRLVWHLLVSLSSFRSIILH
jgi:MFS family permease